MNTSHHIMMTHTRPAFASLRDIVRSLPRQQRSGCAERSQGERVPSWMRLELDQLQRMIRELESGFHLVHPATRQAVQQHCLDVKRTEHGNQRMHDARTPFEDRYEDDREVDVASARRERIVSRVSISTPYARSSIRTKTPCW